MLALDATPLLKLTIRLMSSLRTNTRPLGDVSSSFLASGTSALESLTLSGVELLSLLFRLLDKLSASAFSAVCVETTFENRRFKFYIDKMLLLPFSFLFLLLFEKF